MSHSYQATSSDGGVTVQPSQEQERPILETEPDESGELSSPSELQTNQYDNATAQSESGAAPNNHPNGFAPQGPEPLEIVAVAFVDEPPRPLRWWDVSSLIINKMVGTGIYTAPSAVLSLIGNKREAVGLWIAGFVYTLFSMTIYLEYARKLPHTGGELIYLDEVFPKPSLLFYTVYAFLYILLNSSATNCMQFANQVYISATDRDNPDQRLLRLIAVVILTIVCLLHYFSARIGRDLNIILAASKVLTLGILFVAGAIIANEKKLFNEEYPKTPPISNSPSSSSAAAGFLLILYSFQGWQNATFVAGEIANYRTLRIGFVVAVLTVGILYIIVNVVFVSFPPVETMQPDQLSNICCKLAALSYTEITPENQYAAKFFGDTLKARQAWAVLIAISAVGSLVSIIYTAARVKQAIGRSNILFWSRLWRHNSPFNPATPDGGLILQWIVTVTLISASSAIGNHDEALSFPGSLYVYGQGLIGVFVGCGFLLLSERTIPEPTRRHGEKWTSSYQLKILGSLWGKVPLAVIFIGFNLAILITALIPPYRNADGSPREILGWYYIVIVSAIVLVATTYYFSIHNSAWSILSLAGVQPKIKIRNKHHETYGNRKDVNLITTPIRPNSSQNFVYWVFGGSNEARHPALRIEDWLPRRNKYL
ncbi:hypothetical protein MMC22_005058 [Lobaria immixta]|nr:hypothetical protein [Lobaria immixta]